MRVKAISDVLTKVAQFFKLTTFRIDKILAWVVGGIVAVIGSSLAIYGAAQVSNAMLETGPLPSDIALTNSGVFNGTVPWTILSWLFLILFSIPVAFALHYTRRLLQVLRGNAYGVDKMSGYFSMHDAGMRWDSWAWNSVRRRHLGIPLGRTVWGRPVYGSYDSLGVLIGAPGSGKTSSFVIPAVLDAPGAVFAVSHHPEVVEVTRRPRDEQNRRLWVFDPEDMIGTNPEFSWNPIATVADEPKAFKVAELFLPRFRDTGETNLGRYKESAGLLLTGLILAAAIEGLPLTMVYEWLTTKLEKPLQTLSRYSDPSLHERIMTILNGPTGARTVAATRDMVLCLKGPRVARYLGAGMSKSGDTRWVFDPKEFVTSNDTMYVLCSDGGASALPLVQMLSKTVLDAALEAANTPPHYTLEKPFFAVFESAGLLPMKFLPYFYIQAPGRGLGIMTCVHSWKEGKDNYKEKFEDMWNNSVIRLYTGGVTDKDFLESVSKEVGTYSIGSTNQHLEGRYGSSKGETILSPADLSGLPRDRALLLMRGAAPTLLRKISWRERRDGAELLQKMVSTTAADMNDDEERTSLGTPLRITEDAPVRKRLTKIGEQTKSLITRK